MRRLPVVISFLVAISHSPTNAEEAVSADDLLISNLNTCIARHSAVRKVVDEITEKDRIITAEYSRFQAFDNQLQRLKDQRYVTMRDLEAAPNSKALQQALEFYQEKISKMESLRDGKVLAVFEHMFGRERKAKRLETLDHHLNGCDGLTYTVETRDRVCTLPDNQDTAWCKMAF